MKTHKIITHLSNIDEKYLLDALGNDGIEDPENDSSAQPAKPEIYRAETRSRAPLIAVSGTVLAAAVAGFIIFGSGIGRKTPPVVSDTTGSASASISSSSVPSSSLTTDADISSDSTASQPTDPDISPDNSSAADITEPDTSAASKPDVVPTKPTDSSKPSGVAPEEPMHVRFPIEEIWTKAGDFNVIIARTYVEGAKYPDTLWATSPEELEKLFNNPDIPPHFNYDEEFFGTHNLILIRHEENSGSVIVGVKDIAVKESYPYEIRVDIARTVPEIGTCDMAYRQILIEVGKEYGPDNTKVSTLITTYSTDGKVVSDNPADTDKPHGPEYVMSDSDFTMPEYPGKLFRFTRTSITMEKAMLINSASIMKAALVDINGDGKREIIATAKDETAHYHLYAYDVDKHALYEHAPKGDPRTGTFSVHIDGDIAYYVESDSSGTINKGMLNASAFIPVQKQKDSQ